MADLQNIGDKIPTPAGYPVNIPSITVPDDVPLDKDDATFFIKKECIEDRFILRTIEEEGSYEGRIELTRDTKSAKGRAIICKCFGPSNREHRQFLSVTFRREKNSEPTYATTEIFGEALRELIFPNPPVQGLIVISGTTGSGKSTQLGVLLAKYLNECYYQGYKRQNYLTLEDPIEHSVINARKKILLSSPKHIPYATPTLALVPYVPHDTINYTPRDLRADVTSQSDPLKKALMSDALRQTTNAVLVGEVRDDDDWKTVLNFAGTGHFVIATTHAGSLRLTLNRIFQAVGAKTPEERGFYVPKIRAIIHLQAFPEVTESPKKIIVPSLWRHTPSGAMSLVRDGTDSLHPHTPNVKRDSSWEGISTFGRKWFVERLIAQCTVGSAYKHTAQVAGILPNQTVLRILADEYDNQGV